MVVESVEDLNYSNLVDSSISHDELNLPNSTTTLSFMFRFFVCPINVLSVRSNLLSFGVLALVRAVWRRFQNLCYFSRLVFLPSLGGYVIVVYSIYSMNLTSIFEYIRHGITGR